jgi:hypothetical protein
VTPVAAFSHWLSVEQIRKMQRMRRQTVIKAMELPDFRHDVSCFGPV